MNPFLLRVSQNFFGLLPAVATLLFIILSIVPLGIPSYTVVTPLFVLISVYFWSIYRPDLLPVWAIFLLGTLQDFITGSLLGITAIVLLLVRSITTSQRRLLMGQSFGVEWAGFMMIVGVAEVLAWAIASLYYLSLLSPDPFAVQGMLTAALYPVCSWLFVQTSRVLKPIPIG